MPYTISKIILWGVVSLIASPSKATVFDAAQLTEMFDVGNVRIIEIAVDVPSAMAVQPSPNVESKDGNYRINIDDICRDKELCSLDLYAFPENTEQRMPAWMRDLEESFQRKGVELAGDKRNKVVSGLGRLNNTVLGKIICEDLVGGVCSIESLAAKKITIYMDVLNGDTDLPAKTILWGGKTRILINQKVKYDQIKGIDYAHILGHELSHAQDYRKYRHKLDDGYLWDTETKAYLTQLEIYNELRGRFPDEIYNPILSFLIQTWAWKDNNGPYPKDFYMDGRRFVAKNLIANYFNSARSGMAVIRNAVKDVFCAVDHVNVDFVPGDVVHVHFSKVIWLQSAEYNKWRHANPELANPPIPLLPEEQTDNSEEGGGIDEQIHTPNHHEIHVNPHFNESGQPQIRRNN